MTRDFQMLYDACRDKRPCVWLMGAACVHTRCPVVFLTAFREMNNKYIGSRPVKLRRSEWKDRNLHEVKKKDKQKKKFLKSLGLT